MDQDDLNGKNNDKITFKLDETASTEYNKLFSVKIPINLLKEWSKTQSMPGFRVGKVPLRLLKKEEFITTHLKSILPEIKQELGLEQIFASNYVLDKLDYTQDIEITLSIEKKPNIPFINFNQVEIQTFTAKASDDDAKTAINNYSSYNAKPGEKVLRNSEKGDFLELEVEVKDIKNDNFDKNIQEIRLGNNNFIPTVEESLVNQSIGYTLEHKINEDIQLKLTIKSIKNSVPLSNEDIIQRLQINDKTIEDFFKEKLNSEIQILSKNLIIETIKKLILDTDFELPLTAIQVEYEKIRNKSLSNLNYIKEIDLSDFIKSKLGISVEEFNTNITNIAAAQTKIKFMYYQIAQDNNIKITQEEITQIFNLESKFFNNSLEKTKEFYENNKEAREELLEQILFEKISNYLLSQVKKTKFKEISLSELYKINAETLEYRILNDTNLNQEENKENKNEKEN